MAYQQQNTWWLSGPKNPQGGGCGGACGETGMGGLGQAGSPGVCDDGTPSSVVAAQGSCNDGTLPVCANGQVWAGYCTPTPGVLGTNCPAGQVCSVIPGIPNTFVYLGGAAFALFLLMGVMKR
jgi:hypothetical protein